MSPELEALGRRAVACKWWRWMCGMWASGGDASEPGRVVCDGRGGLELHGECSGYATAWRLGFWHFPDFSDSATRGCLLDLAREAWGDPHLSIIPPRMGHPDEPWTAVSNVAGAHWEGATEAEALVAALEAAP